MVECAIHGNMHARFYFILFLVLVGLKENVNFVQFWGHICVTISDVGVIRLKNTFLQKYITKILWKGYKLQT